MQICVLRRKVGYVDPARVTLQLTRSVRHPGRTAGFVSDTRWAAFCGMRNELARVKGLLEGIELSPQVRI